MNIAGYQPSGRTRIGDVGVWYDAVSAQGAPAGLLRLDPGLLARPGARDRLIAAVHADRRLQQAGMPGLLPVVDLVAGREEIWLITAAPAIPTLADLLRLPPGRGGPDSGSAATVLAETAQALLAVHAAGLAHGAFRPETIVIGQDGAALLAERGLAVALRGEPAATSPLQAQDVAAWAALARGLAATWAADRPAAAELLRRAAETAGTAGLSAARDALLAGRGLLPQGFTTRERLVASLHRWATEAAAGAGPAADRPAAGTDAAADAGEVLRFGPGVPVETTAVRRWRAGRTHRSPPPAADRRDRRRAPSGRQAAWSAVVAALIVTGVILGWLSRDPALVVQAVEVRAPAKTLGCDSTASIVGVITTNGSAGTIHYRWERSDGSVGREQVHTVASGQTTVRVPLRWTVEGRGRFRGTATLRVLSPTEDGEPLEGRATFSYQC